MAISLKAARVNAKLSRPAVIKKLEEKAGIKITVNTLANYENSTGTYPNIIVAQALASIYGMSVDDIIFL
jgi:transcriptional regulator with XRE-family HTH domain